MKFRVPLVRVREEFAVSEIEADTKAQAVAQAIKEAQKWGDAIGGFWSQEDWTISLEGDMDGVEEVP